MTFNEIVLESIIADTPIIITDVQQDLRVFDIKEGPSLGDWLHVPIHSVLGLDPGQENGSSLNYSATSFIPIGTGPLTIKSIIPLGPVTLYPPPRQEEIGVTVRFVPPTSMNTLKVEDLLPSNRALRAAADAKLARAIDRLYARYDEGCMVGAVYAGNSGSGAGEGRHLVGEEPGRIMEENGSRVGEKDVLLGDSGGDVKPGVSAAGGQRASIKREPTVHAYTLDGAKLMPQNGCGNNKAGSEKMKAIEGDVGPEGLVKHEASKGILARVVGLTMRWIWRSG